MFLNSIKKYNIPGVFSFELEHSSLVDVASRVVVPDVRSGKHDFIKGF